MACLNLDISLMNPALHCRARDPFQRSSANLLAVHVHRPTNQPRFRRHNTPCGDDRSSPASRSWRARCRAFSSRSFPRIRASNSRIGFCRTRRRSAHPSCVVSSQTPACFMPISASVPRALKLRPLFPSGVGVQPCAVEAGSLGQLRTTILCPSFRISRLA